MIKRLALGALTLLLGGVLFGGALLYVKGRDYPKPSGDPLTKAAFTGINVVDVVNGRVVTGQTVLVRDGKIKAMGADGSVALPNSVPQIDMRGRYLAPGFWDMHVHLAYIGSEHVTAPVMVANGVLYARDLSSDCVKSECAAKRNIKEMRALQASIDGDEILAPHLVGLASFAVDGPRVAGERGRPQEPSYLGPATAPEGMKLAAYFDERDVDFIKVYNTLPRNAFFGLMAEARRRNLEVVGHLPKSVSLSGALEAGLRSVEHARELPLACSTIAEGYREEYSQWSPLSAEEYVAKKEASPNGDDAINLPKRYREIINTQDADLCDNIITSWAAMESYYVPTHLTREAEFLIADRPYETDPRRAYVNDLVLNISWEPSAKSYETFFAENEDGRASYVDFHELGLDLTGRAHAAGVKILVGTDVGDILIYPGFSFHDEMDRLSQAGLSNADILRAATLTAAEFEGLSATHGSIATGKQASFVFLADNPLADIAHTQSIVGVFHQGHYYDRDALDEVLATASSKTSGLSFYATMGWDLATRALPRQLWGDGGADGIGHHHVH